MEIAGLVLGVVPLVITALQTYTDNKKFVGRLLNRKKHVDKLMRALREQHGVLETNLQSLLVAIDEPCQDMDNITAFLQRSEIRSKVIEYLGDPGFLSFSLALERAQATIVKIAQSIKGFLSEPQVRYPSREISAFGDGQLHHPSIAATEQLWQLLSESLHLWKLHC
jgi:hypothetical protein